MKSLEKLFFLCFLFEAGLCRDFSINLPERIEALSGLCVLIPCSFEIPEDHDQYLKEKVTGIWLKDEPRIEDKVFSSAETEGNKIQGKLNKKLLMKNCTTIFRNIKKRDCGRYYFRLEAQGPLKYTYKEANVYIDVRDSPSSPSITLYKEDQGKVEGQLEVVEGSSVSLICSAPAPCPSNPPTVTWNFLPDENQNSSFTSSQLNFTASHLHHGLNVTCSATYQLKNGIAKSAQSSVTLRVLYAPKNTTTSAFPSASVLVGSSVSLRCSSDANPAVLNYTWYRENGELIGTGNNLEINKTDHKHQGFYWCRAQNQHGDQKSSLDLQVQYAPQISSSSGCIISQESIECFCEVHGNPSPTLEWLQSGTTIPSSESVQSEIYMGYRSSISIPWSNNNSLTTLQCVATNQLGNATQPFSFMSESRFSAAGFDLVSMLIGAAAGASAMLLLCFMYLCVRKEHQRPQSRKADTAGLILNDRVNIQAQDGDCLDSDKTLSPESLHYSTIELPNDAGNEIRGLATLTNEYATIVLGSNEEMKVAEEDESAVPDEINKEKQGTGIRKRSSDSAGEEIIYGNIAHHQKRETL